MVLLKGKPYADRRQAARLLSKSLAGYEPYHPVLLGIPRGGVIVADTIARELKTDLDIVLTRKLGAPGNPELAIGAVSESGRIQIQHEIADKVGADEDYIQREIDRQLAETPEPAGNVTDAYCPRSRWRAARSFWWTTGWRRDRPCRLPSGPPATRGRRRLSSRCPSGPRTRSRDWSVRRMTWSARTCRRTSTPSASSMRILNRWTTRR